MVNKFKFQKKFYENIEIRYAKSPMDPSEQRYQNQLLVKAVQDVLRGILNREPTEEELLGHKKLKLRRATQSDTRPQLS